ncbi:MAG: hypothetical protein SGILL_006379 [Bacillariaceae sp.]
MGEDTKKWQDTLYIWDGIVTVDDTGVGVDADANAQVSWEGTWVPVEEADATRAKAPKRNAFAEYIDSDLKFNVTGSAAAVDTKEDAPMKLFISKLTDGDGWDMESGGEKKKYADKEHEVMVKSLRWSGNMFDQTENLIVAKGTNEFGSFVSAGWMRPGNRWTLARRYLSEENDPRAKLSLRDLQNAVIDETVQVVADTGQQKLKIPPWQCSVLHAENQGPPKTGEKRKADGEADGESPSKEPKQ